jgi:hypothetical protein
MAGNQYEGWQFHCCFHFSGTNACKPECIVWRHCHSRVSIADAVSKTKQEGCEIMQTEIKWPPWRGLLLEELLVAQLVKHFPTFYGTQMVYHRVRKSPPLVLILSQIISLHAPHSIIRRSILISHSHQYLCFASGLLPSGFSSKILYASLRPPPQKNNNNNQIVTNVLDIEQMLSKMTKLFL